ncbi:MAG: hypothetical protein D3926_03545 [Desulfobacteraceae bacterium]|nr:MAG: hypothetical protein D3926_03545 [Desulfobacteraceae bacterium]
MEAFQNIIRVFDCPNYDACLNVASYLDLFTFSCVGCPNEAYNIEKPQEYLFIKQFSFIGWIKIRKKFLEIPPDKINNILSHSPPKENQINMAATKKETVLDFLNMKYNDYNIDFRENSITSSQDFIIDTGTFTVFIKIGQKRWDASNNVSILDFLESKEKQIHEAVLNNQNAILPMK